MKIRLQILLLIIPIIGSAQSLIKCNDEISFFVNQNDNFYCHIKLNGKVGKVDEIGNQTVINFNDYALQTLLLNKQNYISDGEDDIAILTNYIIGETQYFTSIFKEKLDLMMIPVEISKDKKAVIWYFDIPDKIQKQIQSEDTPAVKQVSISITVGNFVYSIGTTLFKGQSFDDLQKLLSDLVMTIEYNNGQIEHDKLCKK